MQHKSRACHVWLNLHCFTWNVTAAHVPILTSDHLHRIRQVKKEKKQKWNERVSLVGWWKNGLQRIKELNMLCTLEEALKFWSNQFRSLFSKLWSKWSMWLIFPIIPISRHWHGHTTMVTLYVDANRRTLDEIVSSCWHYRHRRKHLHPSKQLRLWQSSFSGFIPSVFAKAPHWKLERPLNLQLLLLGINYKTTWNLRSRSHWTPLKEF